ncbi:hypothetical protein POMI540_2225 [Schizosaccharomyces pombe]
MDWEEVTKLEENEYKRGYDEGILKGIEQGYEEAFLFGLEHAYNKYLLAGELYGRVCFWLKEENSQHPKIKKAHRHLEQLKSLLESLPTNNELEETDAGFDSYWNKITAKAKVVSSLLGTKILPAEKIDANDGFE